MLASECGDEFCVLMVDPNGDSASFRAALIAQIDARNAGAARDYRLSASVGCVEVEPGEVIDLDHMLIEADRLMYLEKAARPVQRH